jgi:hypothetical protein
VYTLDWTRDFGVVFVPNVGVETPQITHCPVGPRSVRIVLGERLGFMEIGRSSVGPKKRVVHLISDRPQVGWGGGA